MSEAITVCRVREGVGRLPSCGGLPPERLFSVVLSSPSDDLAVVAAAVDPVSLLAVPAAGDPHPADPAWAARPPIIYEVGIRAKGGPLLASRSCFYNIRTGYVRREP